MTATNLRSLTRAATAWAWRSPSSVRSRSVYEVWRPLALHSVCPCRISTISPMVTPSSTQFFVPRGPGPGTEKAAPGGTAFLTEALFEQVFEVDRQGERVGHRRRVAAVDLDGQLGRTAHDAGLQETVG